VSKRIGFRFHVSEDYFYVSLVQQINPYKFPKLKGLNFLEDFSHDNCLVVN